MEQRAQVRRNESQRQLERNLVTEVERLQREIELAKQSTEMHHLTAETLKREVSTVIFFPPLGIPVPNIKQNKHYKCCELVRRLGVLVRSVS